MPRHPRLQFPGAWYHVTNRGADHQETFRCDDDRRAFLSLLDVIDDRFDIEIHAYCLMGNHHHLLVATPEGNLASAMQYLDGVYTQRFNRRHGRDGPLFRGRYASGLVIGEAQLLATLRYIHRNPVRAGMAARADHYRWSSDRAYRGQVRAPRWLRRDVAKSLIGRESRWYAEFVDEPGRVDIAQPAVPRIRTAPNTPRHGRSGDARPTLEMIDEAVAARLGVPIESLTASSRGRANLGRRLAVVLGHRVARASMQELADRYGFAGTSSVTSAISRFDASRDAAAMAHLSALTAGLAALAVSAA